MRVGAIVASVASVAVAEARTYALGYRRDPGYNGPEPTVLNLTRAMLDAAPTQLDWNKKGAVTPVKDQAKCGSCWAFSTVETVESAVFMAEGKLPMLSEQQLVDCDNSDFDPRGRDEWCAGGLPLRALTWLEAVGGLTSEEDYPYVGPNKTDPGWHRDCLWKKGDNVALVQGHHYAIPPCTEGQCDDQDEEALVAALAEFGPLSISLNADTTWFQYEGGVYDATLCRHDADSHNHAVQLVGYDKTASPAYWIVRNSWGTDWGEKGFIRLPFGVNACGLANEAIAVNASSAAQAIWA